MIGSDVALIFGAYSVDGLQSRIGYLGVVLLLQLLIAILLSLLAYCIYLPKNDKEYKLKIENLTKINNEHIEKINKLTTENNSIKQDIATKNQEIKCLEVLMETSKGEKEDDDFDPTDPRRLL